MKDTQVIVMFLYKCGTTKDKIYWSWWVIVQHVNSFLGHSWLYTAATFFQNGVSEVPIDTYCSIGLLKTHIFASCKLRFLCKNKWFNISCTAINCIKNSLYETHNNIFCACTIFAEMGFHVLYLSQCTTKENHQRSINIKQNRERVCVCSWWHSITY